MRFVCLLLTLLFIPLSVIAMSEKSEANFLHILPFELKQEVALLLAQQKHTGSSLTPLLRWAGLTKDEKSSVIDTIKAYIQAHDDTITTGLISDKLVLNASLINALARRFDSDTEDMAHTIGTLGALNVINYLKQWPAINEIAQDLAQRPALIRELVRIKTKKGDDLLGIAAYLGNIDLVKLCLANGADMHVFPDPKEQPFAYLPLTWAASYGRVEMTKLLLEHGANPNALNGTGDTALYVIAQNWFIRPEHLETIKLLLAFGANPLIVKIGQISALQQAQRSYAYTTREAQKYCQENKLADAQEWTKRAQIFAEIIALFRVVVH